MSLVLDTTLKGVYSNSYVEIAYCDDYWAGHYSSTKAAQWAALSTQQKTTLLIAACRTIDTARYTLKIPTSEFNIHYDYRTRTVLNLSLYTDPIKYYYYQRLQFPRNLDVDTITGLVYVPEPILIAQCEQAIYTLNFDESALAARMQGIVNDTVGIGKGQIHLNQEYVGQGSAFAPMAMELLRPYFVLGQKMRRG